MGIKKIIAIASAKGGVGKSTICASLASHFSKDFKVGILDADIYGPNQHLLFNLSKDKPEVQTIDGKKSFIPIKANNIVLNSMGFILDPGKAAMWRGPMLSGAIKQLKDLTQWGDLDYLFIDMPPGTGDAYLTIASEIKPNYVLLVTSQSALAVQDTIKSKAIFDRLKIPMLGLIDNMSYSICTHCKKQVNEFIQVNLEKEIGLKVLGSIPRDNNLANFNSKKNQTLIEPIYNELLKLL
jgi:ATP-binding protein involved in chromosome partitioning